MDFFENFKPIRNKLNTLSLWDILDKLYKMQKSNKIQLTKEEIEFVYLNSIVYSDDYINSRNDWNQNVWVNILNQCKALNNKISEPLLSPDSDPFDWLRTMGLNQTKTHSNSYLNQLYRYHYIFSNDAKIREHIESKINMTYNDFFICSFWLYSIYGSRNYCFDKEYLLSYDKAPFSSENILKTLGILSLPLLDLKASLKKELRYDENSFNTNGLAGSEVLAFTHLVKPIFEFNNKFYCLFPEQLLHQFTSGMYYIVEIYKSNKLNDPFGSAFEKYVGLILEKNNVLKKLRIQPEIPYNDKQNKTSDWIIETDDAIVFIECKTKRLRKESKMYENNEMEDEKTIKESDTIKIAEAVEQVYKVYAHYSNNEIPGLFFDSSKVFIPIVLTLEEWFAKFPTINDKITELVKLKLKLKEEDVALVDKYKFHIFSISEFESIVQIMFSFGFKNYFDKFNAHEITEQIKQNFEYKNYFKDEINCILTESIKDISRT